MTPRRQRMLVVGLGLAGVAVAVALSLRAFQENLLYFYTPTQVLAGEPPEGKKFRLGGLVEEGSVRREPGALEVHFDVVDNHDRLTVTYAGVLPDLFRDGQGVIAMGFLEPDGTFRADEVLAKHDENYMPPEVADALAAQGHPGDAATPGESPN
ncbi:MAG: cytochrome c maturation protein CcmE [Gammaproteobacteria bacterium]|nr:cytochrome c maturation protein CcmE [Gammaproteobacteria bacterium]MDH5275342.1 cytochrome c maturation protein CcmE [Gammaproteobacteria bacterium]